MDLLPAAHSAASQRLASPAALERAAAK